MNIARVGILGTGKAGQALGDGFVALGHEVKLGSRDADNEAAQTWAARAGNRASVGTFADAASFGDLLVLATLGKANKGVIQAVGADPFGHKVLIDVTNPFDYKLPSPPALFVGTTDSLGERVQRWLPRARVVKAFNTVGAMHFFRPEFPGGPPDMFIAGDDPDAKATVSAICVAFGWGVADVGGIECSRWLEPMCLVWAAYAMISSRTDHAFKLLRK
jgi:predicted dinucleotide-binding enzyme